jgi:cytosine/adenosine deaminase-related metal-dependent hydrolase
MATRTLLKGGAVLSMDARIGNSLDCDVLIEDDKIIAVSSDLQDAKAEVIDASEMIVAPGFIDTHRHMWKGVLRNTGTARPDAGELGARFRPQDIAASTLSSALGALDAGITTVVDFGDFAGGDEHTAADIDAVVQSGLRAVFA